jgi:general secretion pathway protein G
MQQLCPNHVCLPVGRHRWGRPSCGFRNRCRGFTLIELTISVAIVLTVAAMAIPNISSAILQAQNARAVGDIRAIGDDLQAYYASNAQFPNTLADINDKYMDPWGNPYKYLNFANATSAQMRKDRFMFPFNTWFDLYSMGADGVTQLGLTAPESQDDVIWANDGEYVGLTSEYEF